MYMHYLRSNKLVLSLSFGVFSIALSLSIYFNMLLSLVSVVKKMRHEQGSRICEVYLRPGFPYTCPGLWQQLTAVSTDSLLLNAYRGGRVTNRRYSRHSVSKRHNLPSLANVVVVPVSEIVCVITSEHSNNHNSDVNEHSST